MTILSDLAVCPRPRESERVRAAVKWPVTEKTKIHMPKRMETCAHSQLKLQKDR